MRLELKEVWVIDGEISSLLGLASEEHGLLLVDDGRSARWTLFTDDIEYVRVIDAAHAAHGEPVGINPRSRGRCPSGRDGRRSGRSGKNSGPSWPTTTSRHEASGSIGARNAGVRANRAPRSSFEARDAARDAMSLRSTDGAALPTPSNAAR